MREIYLSFYCSCHRSIQQIFVHRNFWYTNLCSLLIYQFKYLPCLFVQIGSFQPDISILCPILRNMNLLSCVQRLSNIYSSFHPRHINILHLVIQITFCKNSAVSKQSQTYYYKNTHCSIFEKSVHISLLFISII